VNLKLEMYLGAPDSIDSADIKGTPDLKLTIPGGIHGDLATAARLYAEAAQKAPNLAERTHLTRQAARLNTRQHHHH